MGKTFTLDEVARILRWDVDCLARLLSRVPGTLPGAEYEDGAWSIPGRAVRDLLAPLPLEQMATVEDVATALRVSTTAVYKWLAARGPRGERLLPSEKRLGRILIPAKAVLALPPKLPDWARSSFFSARMDGEESTPAALSFFSDQEGER